MGRGNPHPKGNIGKGRPKGSKNKITTNLKQMVLDAVAKLEKEGKSLYEVGRADPQWLYVNFVKPMLPRDIDVKSNGEGFKFTLIMDEKSAKDKK